LASRSILVARGAIRSPRCRNSSICSYRVSPIRAILAVTRSPRLCYSGDLECTPTAD
jgi:hypothetical protein